MTKVKINRSLFCYRLKIVFDKNFKISFLQFVYNILHIEQKKLKIYCSKIEGENRSLLKYSISAFLTYKLQGILE